METHIALDESDLLNVYKIMCNKILEAITYSSFGNILMSHNIEIMEGVNCSNLELFRQYAKELYQLLIHQKSIYIPKADLFPKNVKKRENSNVKEGRKRSPQAKQRGGCRYKEIQNSYEMQIDEISPFKENKQGNSNSNTRKVEEDKERKFEERGKKAETEGESHDYEKQGFGKLSHLEFEHTINEHEFKYWFK